ncbi:hypothetical protein BCV69DRAFT_301968 [Microstroma glucosiphilum]|uniref:Uncharacterized protein n=1 Tax=Pseudomicrostroma glucosiphilum TaxID=1684307 RepID=A0A316TWD3_9BASI|nr:hypothetical protein BCV69DRAFT_301968 [Pseudomicrostroma glucosiphilum]PWN17647.1 hypothetical protein BCV69DRAFT_301968 [Pseudomicrostroma glucosiphilum]
MELELEEASAEIVANRTSAPRAQHELAHLRSWLRGRPEFDPSVPIEFQKTLGAKWAKEFCEQEHAKGTPSAEWLSSWTSLRRRLGEPSEDIAGKTHKVANALLKDQGLLRSNPDSDDDDDENADDEADGDDHMDNNSLRSHLEEVPTGTKFVPSPPFKGAEDVREFMSGAEVKVYEQELVNRAPVDLGGRSGTFMTVTISTR